MTPTGPEVPREDDADAVIAAAERVVRDAAASDADLRLDAAELPLRLAAHDLAEAATAAIEALGALFRAAAVYSPLQAAAHRDMAVLGIGDGRRAGGQPPENSVEPDGTIVLRGHAYAPHAPVKLLLQTTQVALTEHCVLDFGAWIELRVVAPVKEDGA